jgi:hypothetical protein
MEKRVFLMGWFCFVLILGMALASCASTPLTKNDFSNEPVRIISEVNTESTKISELSNKVWLGLFGDRTFPSIAETAKAGNITAIATVEYYQKPGIFLFWIVYTTIVTGT